MVQQQFGCIEICIKSILNHMVYDKKVVSPRNVVPFGDYSYYICLWGIKACWLAGLIGFLCIVCTILFNVYFGKFVMKFIDIGVIGLISITKYHRVVIMVNLVKQTWFIAWCCLSVLWCVSPLGVVACLLQGVGGVLRGFLPIYSAGQIGAHQYSGAGSPCWWLNGPVHPEYIS